MNASLDLVRRQSCRPEAHIEQPDETDDRRTVEPAHDETPERSLAEELLAERDLFHQMQTIVSRQGEPIEDLGALRERLSHLVQVQETAPACPPDWGALRIRPEIVELWNEADDRIHERRLFARDGDGWVLTLLSP